MTQKKVNIAVEGMTCVSCAQNIQRRLKKVPGVVDAQVNFSTAQAVVDVRDEKVSHDLLLAAVNDAGYHGELISEGHVHSPDLEVKHHLNEFLLSLALTIPLWLDMTGMLMGEHVIPPLIQLILATLVQFWCGWRFYNATFHSIAAFSANMDVLIALGTSAAYFFSFFVYALELPYPLYFDTSATIITLVLFGRWLESLSRGRASKSMEKLLSLQPKTASVQRGNEFVQIPIDDIQKEDVFLVRPGETIAVDGLVIDGQSSVNESLLTGEGFPVTKKTGSQVYAGTNNYNGILKISASQVGENTLLAGMIRLIYQAQNSKAPIQKLADYVSSIFVPIVLLISLATLVAWWFLGDFNQGLINAISVLVIACPCALGLATPTVVIVASGCAAEEGILFKEAGALEEVQKIDTIIFDKTGTLTEGKPSIVEVITLGNYTENDLVTIAAALEHNTHHPLANAILDYAKEIGVDIEPVSHFEEFSGKGISAEKRGQRYFVGSTRFAEEKGVVINQQRIESLEDRGYTLCVVWHDREIVGYIAISDLLRKNSSKAIQYLNHMGIRTHILSGDDERTVESIANELGIQEFWAEILPEYKAEHIMQMKNSGKVVGMVGDGINDAPALAASNVGFALASGSDIAIETSDITLIHGDLMGVVNAIQLSKEAFRKIRQNLFFAFVYNGLGIPLAAFGLLNPIIAAAAMALSSICVVGNALLLKKWKKL